MEADWSVLLTADAELEVVAGASFVGSAGSVLTGLMGVVEVIGVDGAMGLVKYVFSDIFGVFGADKSSFLQPISNADINIADRTIADISVALGWLFDFFMLDSS